MEASMVMVRGMRLVVVGAVFVLTAVAGVGEVAAQSACNASYDDGTSEGYEFFGGGQAGDPDYMYAVLFELADFGYEPGNVEITAVCAGNQFDSEAGVFANQIFIYPDVDGAPDDSVVLGQGTILTGNGVSGEEVIVLDRPVVLDGDFWVVNRGFPRFADTDFNMEHDASTDGGHSYSSETGIEGLDQEGLSGDLTLRTNLREPERTYLVGGMAHTAGANDSQWRSKLVLLNSSGSEAAAAVEYVSDAESTPVDVTLSPGEMAAWDDVVVDLFEADDSSGAIRVDADRTMVVTARTYNLSDSGTFGQFLPGVDQGQTLRSGQTALLSQLANNEQFRTNIGFVNLVDKACRVEITLHDAAGDPVGEVRSLRVPASAWNQDNDTFVKAGAGEHDDAWARVELVTNNCAVWGYASVIDQASNDPTTIPIVIE
jgi:hypothetical protein